MLTQSRLKEVMSFDPETGLFTWLVSRGNGNAGSIAGCNSNGYIAIKIDGKSHKAHRLAWLYVYGSFPKHELDHINHVKTDNRICNLRDVTHAQNKQNMRVARTDNKSGLIGAMFFQGRWQAKIMFDNKRRYLGTFATPEEAHSVYVEAKRNLHEFGTL